MSGPARGMSGRTRRRKPSSGGGGGHGGGDERWMASYMDMVTVLMCLFIVLFAMSSVDQKKFEQLKVSLSTGFGVESSDTVDAATGVIVPPESVGDEGLFTNNASAESLEPDVADPELLEMAAREADDLLDIQRRIEKNLAAAGHEDGAEFHLDEDGLTVRLVSAETFFEPNKATLTPTARDVLNAIAPVIAPTDRSFEVGGHADTKKPVAPYPTNWELSASRATGVLRALVERGGVNSKKIVSVGYGDAHPIAGADRLRLNRRVDVVVLSDERESVRELLSIAAAR